MNIKSSHSHVTESGKRVGELQFQPGRAGPRPVEGLVRAWRGGGLGGDERSSHALKAPGELWWQMWRLGPRPPSLPHPCYFPSSLVWCHPLHVLACLLPVYGLQSITLPSLLYKYKHSRPDADAHWTGETASLMTNQNKLCLLVSEEGILPRCQTVVIIFFILCHYKTESIHWSITKT